MTTGSQSAGCSSLTTPLSIPTMSARVETSASLAITDHYRCPDSFVTALHSMPSSGGSKVRPDPFYFDSIGAARMENGQLFLPINPTEVINSLRYEKYVPASKGFTPATTPGRLLSELYYSVRPFLPVSFRKHLQRIYLNGWSNISFPRWPLDVTVEHLFETSLLLLMKATGIEEIPFIWFWPNGADSAAMMTHDVETASGRNFCNRLMDIDESFGIRSSFQIVPEDRYTVTPSFLEEIRTRGHEINIQDLNHDGRLFANRSEFELRATRINRYGREFGARGFRSAVLYRNLDWFDRLDFEYDMTVPNVGHLEAQRGGCCTVFPYFVGGLLELPLTTTQDYTLFHILRDHRLELWKKQAAGVTARHGLLSFIVHPDYLLESKARDTYHDLLEFLNRFRSERGMWIATASELNDWWRLRSRMTLTGRRGAWRMKGQGSERAQVAYARIRDGRVTYARDETPASSNRNI